MYFRFTIFIQISKSWVGPAGLYGALLKISKVYFKMKENLACNFRVYTVRDSGMFENYIKEKQ